jgi:transcriptional regulator with XRE-family HTH domain
MSYHYGQTIKEYRLANKMTLEQLASRWPSKETGVNIRYVIDVEAGRKRITDMETLRKLAAVLHIPLWKFGLSEYDPFNEKDEEIQSFTDISALLEVIEDTWYIRLNMSNDIVEKKIWSLSNIFARLISNNSRILNNKDFLVLYAQVKRLQEVAYTERRDYDMSLQCAYDMLNLATRSGDAISETIAMTRIGVELLRNENRESLEYLERARDLSFSTSSKEVAAYSYSFLARAYATFEDEKRFMQAINTAITLANNMRSVPVVTKDYTFHAYSAILEEKTNGLILLGRGKEALSTLPEIDAQIAKENNTSLRMWMPLDYAQSFMKINEIEASIQWLEKFYDYIRSYKSVRVSRTIERHLNQLDRLGYANLPVVKDFKNMYYGVSNDPAIT